MTIKEGMPKVFIEMAERYDTRFAKECNLDALSFFSHVPELLWYISDPLKRSISTFCEALVGVPLPLMDVKGNFLVPRGGQVTEQAAHVFNQHRKKHGFEGTLILSLIERAAGLSDTSIIGNLKEEARKNRKVDPLTWELFRHFGRPSVPGNVLPVFAVYEAEKALDRPITRLTEAQMRVIGL
jgi:hypothetical protein